MGRDDGTVDNEECYNFDLGDEYYDDDDDDGDDYDYDDFGFDENDDASYIDYS